MRERERKKGSREDGELDGEENGEKSDEVELMVKRKRRRV